jgi:hypothetical protein
MCRQTQSPQPNPTADPVKEGYYFVSWPRCRTAFRKCEGQIGDCDGQELRFCLRSSSHVWPSVLIQFDASSSEDASKISSEWVPSSVAQTDHTGP